MFERGEVDSLRHEMFRLAKTYGHWDGETIRDRLVARAAWHRDAEGLLLRLARGVEIDQESAFLVVLAGICQGDALAAEDAWRGMSAAGEPALQDVATSTD